MAVALHATVPAWVFRKQCLESSDNFPSDKLLTCANPNAYWQRIKYPVATLESNSSHLVDASKQATNHYTKDAH